jgi:hypothetical protein
MSRTQPRPPGRKGGPPKKADPLRLVEPVANVTPVDRLAPVEFVNLPGGQKLVLPDEPVELGEGLRDALLDGRDWREGFSDDNSVGVWLWNLWQPTLEPIGFGREEFVATVIDTQRELWLWLIGDRLWNQYVTGLAGRIGRRVPQPDAQATP